MRRTLHPTLAAAVLAALALVAAASLAGYWYLRRSLPTIDGTVAVAGISGPIEIVRDRDDVPHIFASSKADALFGLGYVHAQDRLWQMEFQRRIGFGRLSEIFGSATVSDDRFLRTVGFGRAARSAWDHLPPDSRTQVESYLAGVNAFIGAHHGSRLPPEFLLLGFEPQPWSGPDVLVWAKMMAWDLGGNYSLELMRHDLEASVGAERMEELLPPYPLDGLNIVSEASPASAPPAASKNQNTRAGHSSPSWSALLARGLGPLTRDFLSGDRVESLGSNNWVVDGTMTASGKPLLANDPHLGAHLPSLWYLAHMSAGDFDVIGATLPGLPAVAIGRNRFIAWGETNVGADVEDLYRERIDANLGTAEFRGSQEPLRIVHETIAVKGGAPIPLDVRMTRHGPLVSDAINANNAAAKEGPKAPPLEPLALRWTALDDEDETIPAFLKVNEAKNWKEFTDGLRLLAGPSQNFVYGDADGHIGYYAPGHIPVRAGQDGTTIADGWSGAAEWTGWIPFDELPHAFDPPGHFIVTANNRPEPPSYPYYIASEYPQPYRARRIVDLLRGRTRLTAGDFRDMQADTRSLHAAALLPLLIAHAHPAGARDRQAVEILKGWNFDARGDAAAPAIFEAWFLALEPAIAGDELGSANAAYQGRFSYVTRFVTRLLTPEGGSSSGATSDWCDDIRTPVHETCDEEVTRALHEGVEGLASRLGGDIERWRWDAVHQARFPHQGLDAVRLLRPLLSRSMPNGGDWSTIDVGAVDVDHPFDQIAIPGYRQIVDLSPANDSRFIDAAGESGHFLSTHYTDYLQDWHDVKHHPMRLERADVDRGAIGRLILKPE